LKEEPKGSKIHLDTVTKEFGKTKRERLSDEISKVDMVTLTGNSRGVSRLASIDGEHRRIMRSEASRVVKKAQVDARNMKRVAG
jgi:hypothetical protein